MKKLMSLVLVSIGLLSGASYANEDLQAQKKAQVETLISQYLQTWSTADDAERMKKMKKVWEKTGAHQSPYGRSEGIMAMHGEIRGFIKSQPPMDIHCEDLKVTGNNAVCTFFATDKSGKVIFTGTDYFKFTEQGKLVEVIGFL